MQDQFMKIYYKKSENPNPLVYIQFMRFARRAEGIESARKIFIQARKSPSCSYHIYIASALMEYHLNNDSKIARNIFELGLKKHMEPSYVLEYINFLTLLNETNNIKVLYERVLSSMPSEKATEIWNRFLAFEISRGDLPSISKVEKRRAAAYPDQDPTGFLTSVQRYQYMDLWPCRASEVQAASASINMSKDSDSSNGTASRYPRPDLSQMILYTPLASATTITITSNIQSSPSLPVQFDGVPQMVVEIIMALPNEPYQGPVPDIDRLLDYFQQTPLPQKTTPPQPEKVNGKRKKPDEDSDDEENTNETSSSQLRPTGDIYTNRQQKKLSKHIKNLICIVGNFKINIW